MSTEVVNFHDIEVKEQSVLSLDDADNNAVVTLLSKDNQVFTVNKKFVAISNLIVTALTSKEESEVPIPGVNGSSLSLVVDYINHHQGVEPPIIEKPLRSKIMKDLCKDPWDAEFIDKVGQDRQQLYNLVLAANYVDIKSLLHLCCAKIASLIKGQPLEKIKEILTPAKK